MLNNIKVGVILCAYGSLEYLRPCIEPWVKLKDKYNIKITAVHGQFKEIHELGIPDDDQNTQAQLEIFREKGYLDYLYLQNDYLLRFNNPEFKSIYQTEAEIRDKALQWLLKENVDAVILLDLDEFYTTQQIENVIEYINREDNKFYVWNSIHLKNYVMDNKTWIDDFCPPRIFRTTVYNTNIKLQNFHFDNDVFYKDLDSGQMLDYRELPNKTVPKNLVFARHLTWMDDEKSHQKILYHEKHFSHGAGCSYIWRDGHLAFNENYYEKIGQPIPVLNKDE